MRAYTIPILLVLVLSGPSYATHETDEVKSGCLATVTKIVRSYQTHKKNGASLEDGLVQLMLKREQAQQLGSPWGTDENYTVFANLWIAVYHDQGVQAAVAKTMERCIAVLNAHPKQEL